MPCNNPPVTHNYQNLFVTDLFLDRIPFKLIENVNKRLIIVNKHGCPPSPVYTFHYKQGRGNILSKTPVFRLIFFPIYCICGASLVRKRQISAYIFHIRSKLQDLYVIFKVSRQPTSRDMTKMVLHLVNSWETYLTGNWQKVLYI